MGKRLSIVLSLMALLAVSAWCQFNVSLQGTVQDPSSASIPRALVRIRNVQTGVTQQTQTNDSGYYRFPSLAPGAYEVSVEMTGFQKRVVSVQLSTGQSRDLDFPMEVQGASSSVQVTAEAQILDTAETRNQLTIQQSQARDLPLMNNSLWRLMSLAPGVVGTNGTDDNFNPEYFSGISANGRSAYGNSFNVDGLNVSSNITNGTSNLGLNPEAVQEVSIQTNTFTAEQGLGSSIVVSMTTKSGTNEYHGSGNYWFTDQDMRARTSLPFVAAYAPFTRQDVTAGFGGPIVKNKTFFFSSMEMLRSKNASTGTVSYESPEFAAWARANAPNSFGTQMLTKYPITGPVQTNVLQTAQQVLGAANCGTPATMNIPCGMPMIVQGTWNRSPYRNGLEYTIRGDQYLRNKDRLYGSYVRSYSDANSLNVRPGFTVLNSRDVKAYQGNWTHTFSPTVINELGYSGNIVFGGDGPWGGVPYRIPYMNIQNTQGFGSGGGTFIQHNNTWREVVTWMKGTHALKFGGTAYWGDDYADFVHSSRPTYTYLNLLAFVNDQPNTGNYGSYDPLTGKPNAYRFGAKLTTFSVFAQDEWKVRPNLTLTASIRWDDFGNPTGLEPWKTTNIFVAPGNTVDEQFANASIKLVDPEFPSRLNKNFSPRLGVAWSPGSSRKWAIRGGVGLYNDWITLGETVDRVNVNPPNFVYPNFGLNLPLKPVLLVGTQDTYPFGYNLPTLTAYTLDAHGGIAGLNSGVGGLDPNLKTPKSVNYTAGMERELAGRTVVGASYSGSYTWDGLTGTDYNRFPGDLLDGTLNRLNPSFGSMWYIRNINVVHYNAMILSVRKDLGARGSLQGSYTLGHARNLYDGGERSVGGDTSVDPRLIAAFPADASYDVRHRVSAAGVYRLPAPFAQNVLARRILGGWELASTAILQTGTPLTFVNSAAFNPIRDSSGKVTGLNPNSGDYNADNYNYDYPNVPAGLPQKYDRTYFLGANGGRAAYNASQFTAPTLGTEGNSPRNYFRQQGTITVDSSVIKNNRLSFIRENFNLQIKFEFFNVLNRVNLSGITNNVASPNFGKITGQGSPRVVQVGARVAF